MQAKNIVVGRLWDRWLRHSSSFFDFDYFLAIEDWTSSYLNTRIYTVQFLSPTALISDYVGGDSLRNVRIFITYRRGWSHDKILCLLHWILCEFQSISNINWAFTDFSTLGGRQENTSLKNLLKLLRIQSRLQGKSHLVTAVGGDVSKAGTARTITPGFTVSRRFISVVKEEPQALPHLIAYLKAIRRSGCIWLRSEYE
jgi:hypothetical protein